MKLFVAQQHTLQVTLPRPVLLGLLTLKEQICPGATLFGTLSVSNVAMGQLLSPLAVTGHP